MLLAALCLLCPPVHQAAADSPTASGPLQVRAVRARQPAVIDGLGDFEFAHSLDRMLSSQADNVFLIKVT